MEGHDPDEQQRVYGSSGGENGICSKVRRKAEQCKKKKALCVSCSMLNGKLERVRIGRKEVQVQMQAQSAGWAVNGL